MTGNEADFNNTLTVHGTYSEGTASGTVSATSVATPCTFTVTTPVVTIDKTAAAGTVSAGSPISFTITVRNTGTAATPGTVTFTDPLPTGAGIIWTESPDSTSCTITGGNQLSCTIPSLAANNNAPGGPDEFSVTVTSPTTSASCGLYNNTATLSSPYTATDSASVIVQCPDVAVTKVGTEGPVNPGAAVSYTITVTNIGAGNATDVTVVDILPDGVHWSEADPECTIGPVGPDPQVLNCTFANIAAGGQEVIVVSGTVPLTFCGLLTNPLVTVDASNEPNTAPCDRQQHRWAGLDRGQLPGCPGDQDGHRQARSIPARLPPSPSPSSMTVPARRPRSPSWMPCRTAWTGANRSPNARSRPTSGRVGQTLNCSFPTVAAGAANQRRHCRHRHRAAELLRHDHQSVGDRRCRERAERRPEQHQQHRGTGLDRGELPGCEGCQDRGRLAGQCWRSDRLHDHRRQRWPGHGRQHRAHRPVAGRLHLDPDRIEDNWSCAVDGNNLLTCTFTGAELAAGGTRTVVVTSSATDRRRLRHLPEHRQHHLDRRIDAGHQQPGLGQRDRCSAPTSSSQRRRITGL